VTSTDPDAPTRFLDPDLLTAASISGAGVERIGLVTVLLTIFIAGSTTASTF
jgi:hypothetical protein